MGQVRRQNPFGSAALTRALIDRRDGATAIPGPELTIVEFSDFQCPFCARVQTELVALRRQYGEHIAIVFRHFPISSHRDSEWLAKLSECARQQGKFWEMHDRFFGYQNELNPAKALALAREIGLNEESSNACMGSPESGRVVAEDKQTGFKIGVTGTPTFIVNGRLVLANQSLTNVVDEEGRRMGIVSEFYMKQASQGREIAK